MMPFNISMDTDYKEVKNVSSKEEATRLKDELKDLKFNIKFFSKMIVNSKISKCFLRRE